MIYSKDPIAYIEKFSKVFRWIIYILSGILLVISIYLLFTQGLWKALIPLAVATLLVFLYTGRISLEEQRILLAYCDPDCYRRLYENKKAAGQDPSETMEEKADFYSGQFEKVIETQRTYLSQPMPPRQTNQDRKTAVFFLAFALYFTGHLDEAAQSLEEYSADLPHEGMQSRLLAFLDDMNEENYANAVELANKALRSQKDDLYRVFCAYCAALGYEAAGRQDAAAQMYHHILRVDNKTWFAKQAMQKVQS